MSANLQFSAPEQMLDPPALAAMLRISVRHLTDVRRDDPTFPQPRMFGTLPRWSPDAIRAWMWPTTNVDKDTDQRRQQPPTAPATAIRKAGRSRVQ